MRTLVLLLLIIGCVGSLHQISGAEARIDPPPSPTTTGSSTPRSSTAPSTSKSTPSTSRSSPTPSTSISTPSTSRSTPSTSRSTPSTSQSTPSTSRSTPSTSRSSPTPSTSISTPSTSRSTPSTSRSSATPSSSRSSTAQSTSRTSASQTSSPQTTSRFPTRPTTTQRAFMYCYYCGTPTAPCPSPFRSSDINVEIRETYNGWCEKTTPVGSGVGYPTHGPAAPGHCSRNGCSQQYVGGILVDICCCNDDFCNEGIASTRSTVALLAGALALLCFFYKM